MRVKSFLLWGFLVISWFRGVYGACSTALGMENRNIKDEQISASSQNSYKAKPSYARLNNKLSFGGWCAKDTDKNSFLQIDLLFPHTLTRIATQGAASNYVGQYSLTFSYDNISWFNYTVGGKIKFFRGNFNNFLTVYNNLTEPLTTRVIRFHPVFVQGTASCARLELYGCQPSEDCNTAVGVEDRKITDQQITASSHWNQHHASNARLNNKLRSWSNSSGVGVIWGGWCTDKLDNNQYLQVDLSRVRSISGVATQGYMWDNFVTKYKMNYSTDGYTWRSYRNRGAREGKTFQGNWDNDTVIKKMFSRRIFARYIRFNPLAWNTQGNICMRVEIYECLPTKGKDSFLDTRE